MSEKKSTSTPRCTRLDDVIRRRIGDEFAVTEVCLTPFQLWIDAELAKMESRFRAFMTPSSQRQSLGR